MLAQTHTELPTGMKGEMFAGGIGLMWERAEAAQPTIGLNEAM
jgi:hypothetical protein